jgi:hypothetical protein
MIPVTAPDHIATLIQQAAKRTLPPDASMVCAETKS